MSQFFRASVGAVISNSKGQLLACERSDNRGAWQFPQGGLDHGEEPLEAVYREIEEETGIGPASLTLLGQHPQLLSYELPPQWRTPKVGRGQTQRWFLFRFEGDDQAITLPASGEFSQWRWLTFQELMPLVADFRKELYLALAREFGARITLDDAQAGCYTPPHA